MTQIAATAPYQHSPILPVLKIQGLCCQCGEKTESLVMFDGAAQFLCPGCGEAIRKC